MSAASFTLTYDNTSDATFRAWVSALDAQITALGWVHGTDTGQFNFTTGTRSATAGANFVIYKSADAISPTIVLKVEFIAVLTTKPGFVISVGFATDGAGNLTGVLQTTRWANQNNTTLSDTVARNCIISGDAGRLAFALNMNAVTAGNSCLVSVERSKDTSGADTGDAVLVTMIPGGTAGGAGMTVNGVASHNAFQYLPTTGTAIPSVEDYLPLILSNTVSGSGAFGTTIGFGVPIPLAGSAQNPGTNVLAALTADYPTRDSTVTVSLYGTNHTYYSLGPNWTHLAATAGTVTNNASMLMRDD